MSLNINFDAVKWHLTFAPHTLNKPLSELRIGIFTNSERYAMLSPGIEIGHITEDYLQALYPNKPESIAVCPSFIPDETFIEALRNLNPGQALAIDGEVVAYFQSQNQIIEYKGPTLSRITERWHLFQKNEAVLKADFQLISRGRKSQNLPAHCTLIGDPENLFIEDGAIVNASTLNVSTGPIYIGKGVEIMEGSLIRGPFAACESAQVKMGSKIYGATTIGPHCKVGGELNNVIFEAYSNKSHDGFLGNGYIGSWCNLGADTNASNLMNNYGSVDVYSFESKGIVASQQQFIGLFMGDHSKCGINTMFNTGTVVGLACNIYGPGFFKKYIPSFSFGEPNRMVPYRMDKALEGMVAMMSRRNKKFSDLELAVLKYIQTHFSS